MPVLVLIAVLVTLVGCVGITTAPSTSVPTPAATAPGATLPPPTAQLTPPPTATAAPPTPAPTPPPTECCPTTATPAPEPSATQEPTVTPQATPAGTPDPNATPAPTKLDILPFLSSEMTILNLADQELSVTATLIDPDNGEEFVVGTFELSPLQVTSQAVVPTRLRLDFDFPGGGDADAGTCTIDVENEEEIQFAAIAGGVAITTGAIEPADPAELLVATASRCQAGAS